MLLEFFIGHKGRAEDQEERPADPQAAAAEIEHQEGAEEPAEKELQNIDEPKLRPCRVFGICAGINPAIQKEYANGGDGKVGDDPEILPERIDALERYRVKGESAQKRDRGDGPFQARVGTFGMRAERCIENSVWHGAKPE